MLFTKNAAITTAALVALVQLCPAPFLFPAGGAAATASVAGGIGTLIHAAGTVTGTIFNGVEHEPEEPTGNNTSREQGRKREQSRVAALGFCKNQLSSASVNFDRPAPGSIHVTGVPPGCMALVKILDDKNDPRAPIVLGDDAVLFQNLSDDEIKGIQDELNGHPSYK
ncbi:hypothetical protein Hte_010619 [Hypoxylon texense]